MTSETTNLHVSRNLNISKTKQDIEKLKTPIRLLGKCCSFALKIRSMSFSLYWHFTTSVRISASTKSQNTAKQTLIQIKLFTAELKLNFNFT